MNVEFISQPYRTLQSSSFLQFPLHASNGNTGSSIITRSFLNQSRAKNNSAQDSKMTDEKGYYEDAKVTHDESVGK